MTRNRVLVSALLSVALFAVGYLLLGGLLRRPPPDAPRDLGVPAPPPEASALADAAAPGGTDAAAEQAEDAPEPAGEAGDAPEEGPLSLSGRVTDSAGEGVPAATVIAVDTRAWRELLADADQRFQGDPAAGIRHYRDVYRRAAARLPRRRTDDDGRYAFHALEPAEYRVVVSQPEFLPEKEGHVLVVEGEPATHDVELVAGSRISGRVVDAEGHGLAGASVEARTSEDGEVKGLGKLVQAVLGLIEGDVILEVADARTGGDGSFALGSLEPVLHDIEVRKEGFAPRIVRKVPPGTSDAIAVLDRGILVKGRVVSSRGDPVGGASVELGEPKLAGRDIDPIRLAREDRDLLGDRTARAGTKEDGSFEVAAASSGILELRIQAARFPSLSLQVEVGGRSVDLGRISLAEPQTIAGVVLDPGGVGLVGVEVSAVPGEGAGPRARARVEEPAASAATGEGGAFVIEGLAQGAYRVEAFDAELGAAAATGVAAGRLDVRLLLGLGRTVRGRVLDQETRAPVPDVEVRSGIGQRPGVKTDASGEFAMRGISDGAAEGTGGRLIISVRHPEYDPTWKEVRPGDDAPVEILLSRTGGFLGTVLDTEGRPVEGARIRLDVPGAPSVLLLMEGPAGAAPVAYSDRDGRFFLPAPRRRGFALDVVAERAGKGRARVAGLQGVEEGSWPELELVLAPGARLEGTVLDPDGAPVEGARIRAAPVADLPAELRAMLSVLGPSGGGDVSYSRKDGTYEIRDLDPRPCRIEVAARGYATLIVEPVEVVDGTTRRDFVLDPGASLSGRVVDIARAPLAAVEVVAFRDPDASGTAPGAAPGREADRHVRLHDRLIQDAAGLGAALAKTQDDGTYVLTHLAEGRYRVVARAKGYEIAEAPGLDAGGSVPDLVLVPLARIRGTVLVAPLGVPATAFRVSLRRTDREGVSWSSVSPDRREETFSPSDGAYALEDLPAGAYEVRVSSGNLAPSVRRVALGPGEDRAVDFVLSPGGLATGRIVSSSGGEPISGVEATIRPERREGEAVDPLWIRTSPTRANTGPDGAFEISGLGDGSYSLTFRHEGYYAADDAAAIRFSVPSEVPLQFDVVLHPAGRVRGAVRGLLPLGEGEYRILTLSGVDGGGVGGGEGPGRNVRRSFSTVLAGEGAFSLGSLPPGTYAVEIAGAGGRARPSPPDGSPAPTRLGTVEIRAGEEAVFEAEAAP